MGRPSSASFTKSGSTLRLWKAPWVGTGAGAAVPTKANGTGVLTRQGVGLYTMTYGDVGGKIAGCHGVTHTGAAVSPQFWKVVAGSFSSASKTVQLECWASIAVAALGASAVALADPPMSSFVDLEVVFLDNSTDGASV